MRKFIISAAVAVVAAVSFAAPSHATYYSYGHNSYGYKSHGYSHYSYKPYRVIKRWKHHGGHYGKGHYGGKIILKKKYYGYY